MLKGVGLLAVISLTTLVLVVPRADAAFVAPSSHNYGVQTIGTTTGATPVTLITRNVCLDFGPTIVSPCERSSAYTTETTALGAGPSGIVTVGDFVIYNIDCPYPSFGAPPATNSNPAAAYSASCRFGVNFVPTTVGARSLTLSFPDTDGTTATLNLTGTGFARVPTSHRKGKCKKKRHRAAAAAKKKCRKRRR